MSAAGYRDGVRRPCLPPPTSIALGCGGEEGGVAGQQLQLGRRPIEHASSRSSSRRASSSSSAQVLEHLAAASSCLLRLLRLQRLLRLLRFRLFLTMSEVSRSLGCVGIDGVSRPSFFNLPEGGFTGHRGLPATFCRQPCTRYTSFCLFYFSVVFFESTS